MVERGVLEPGWVLLGEHVDVVVGGREPWEGQVLSVVEVLHRNRAGSPGAGKSLGAAVVRRASGG